MRKLIELIVLSAFIAATISSCAVIITPKKDQGKHKGWFKNRHNPHHPNSDNPGHQKKNPGHGKKLYEVHSWQF